MGKQFVVNGETIDLPKSGTVTKDVAEKACEIILRGAREGSGENTPCKGMLVLVGSEEQYDTFGKSEPKYNKFKGKELYVKDCLKEQGKGDLEYVMNSFMRDLALFVDGKSGKIFADSYNVDLNMDNVDKNGGSKHRVASAAGRDGCLAIKCSEDCCTTTGGKGSLKVFSGTKTPKSVPVKDKEDLPRLFNDKFDILQKKLDNLDRKNRNEQEVAVKVPKNKFIVGVKFEHREDVLGYTTGGTIDIYVTTKGTYNDEEVWVDGTELSRQQVFKYQDIAEELKLKIGKGGKTQSDKFITDDIMEVRKALKFTRYEHKFGTELENSYGYSW